MCLLMTCLFCGLCIPASFVDDYRAFLPFVWGIYFMAGFIEPILMGILLNTVNILERPVASSLCIFIEYLLGFLPAPYLYGLINKAKPIYND